ncbi:MAG: hypothetical protein AAF940_02980 [Pseudomonadota bacterium]
MSEDMTEGWFDPGAKNAQLVYVLYFLSLFLGGIPAIIGVVFAYMNRGKIGGFVDNHYTWLIRTFWIGLAYTLVAAVLMLVGIGFLLLLAVFVWLVIRLVKGIQNLGRREPMPDLQTWWI